MVADKIPEFPIRRESFSPDANTYYHKSNNLAEFNRESPHYQSPIKTNLNNSINRRTLESPVKPKMTPEPVQMRYSSPMAQSSPLSRSGLSQKRESLNDSEVYSIPSTLKREEIMQKIYDYYRKSVSNTPVPMQEREKIYSSPESTYAKRMSQAPPQSYSYNTLRRKTPTEVYRDSYASHNTIESPNDIVTYRKPLNYQNKIYDEVHELYQDYKLKNKTIEEISPRRSAPSQFRTSSSSRKDTSELPTPTDPSASKYNSNMFRPIAQLYSKIFTDNKFQPNILTKRNNAAKESNGVNERPIERCSSGKYRKTISDRLSFKRNISAIEDRNKRYSIRRELEAQEFRRHTATNTMPHYQNHGNGRRSVDFEVIISEFLQLS